MSAAQTITEQRVERLHRVISGLYHETESVDELFTRLYDDRLSFRNGEDYRRLIDDEHRYSDHIRRIEIQAMWQVGRKQVAAALIEKISFDKGVDGAERIDDAHRSLLDDSDHRSILMLDEMQPHWVIGGRFYLGWSRFASLALLGAGGNLTLENHNPNTYAVARRNLRYGLAALSVATNNRLLGFQGVNEDLQQTAVASVNKIKPSELKLPLTS